MEIEQKIAAHAKEPQYRGTRDVATLRNRRLNTTIALIVYTNITAQDALSDTPLRILGVLGLSLFTFGIMSEAVMQLSRLKLCSDWHVAIARNET
jgi:hypothetical protein